jgi:hypothetical protein
LRSAFADVNDTEIVLTADISLTDCGGGGGDLARAGGDPLTIRGNGHTIEQTCSGERVLHVDDGDLTVVGTIITGGDAVADEGGGILVSSGDLALEGSRVTGNNALNGGGVSACGNISVSASSIDDNPASMSSQDGGGILASCGKLTVTDSTVAGNSAWYGGGIARDGSGGASADTSITVIRSTISGNTAGDGCCGGIASLTPVVLVNSTVSGNSAADGPGGVAGPNITLIYSTVVDNEGPDVANVGATGTLTAFGSVIAGARGGGVSCSSSSTVSNGYNLSDTSDCGFDGATDKQGAAFDPKLGPLASNGGPTMTHAPAAGSPLLDAIPAASCQADGAAGVTTDQRGITRPQGSGCDIGSAEVVVAAPVPLQPSFTG